MRRSYVKIRGIYTTALTRLVLDLGYRVTHPSFEICERFQIPETEAAEDISIVDRDDKQGIRISGEPTLVEEFIRCLWKVLLDMVVRREPRSGKPEESEEELVAHVEFPGATKTALDGLRARVLPTMTNHHRLRIIASDYLDLLERQIEEAPQRQKKLEHDIVESFLLQPLKKHGIVRFEHVRPEGETLDLREGELLSVEGGKLIIRREFQKGHYDGLDLPIKPGDYGMTEANENAWTVMHRYFSKKGELKGEYANVNTPIELYPDRIRYVDLHIDVVRKPKEAPKIIDEERLEATTQRGVISRKLQAKALEVSRDLLGQMKRVAED